MNSLSNLQIWSAVPSPLNDDLSIDGDSVHRMVKDAVANGVTGLFLAGTCGEGPWIRDRDRNDLIKLVVAAGEGKLKIAAQVTDNSVPRMVDNMEGASQAGADYAIMAAPATMMNATPDRIVSLYTEAIEASPLPVGIYDLGTHRSVMIPEERLKDIYLLPKVHLVKDSSGSKSRRDIALAARKEKPSLSLFNGDEFRCVEYLEAGYGGMLFGGAVAVAPYIKRIAAHFSAGEIEQAKVVEAEMRQVLYGIYGGQSITCWLTGLKYCMVKKGIFTSFKSFLGYPLTDECRAFIDGYTTADV